MTTKCRVESLGILVFRGRLEWGPLKGDQGVVRDLEENKEGSNSEPTSIHLIFLIWGTW